MKGFRFVNNYYYCLLSRLAGTLFVICGLQEAWRLEFGSPRPAARLLWDWPKNSERFHGFYKASYVRIRKGAS